MFLWPAAGCAHLVAVSTSPRVFSRPAPAHKAYANLPDRLRCAQTNYFAPLQPRMRNRCYLVIHLFVLTLADYNFLPLPDSRFSLYYALRSLRVTCDTAKWFNQAEWKRVRAILYFGFWTTTRLERNRLARALTIDSKATAWCGLEPGADLPGGSWSKSRPCTHFRNLG